MSTTAGQIKIDSNHEDPFAKFQRQAQTTSSITEPSTVKGPEILNNLTDNFTTVPVATRLEPVFELKTSMNTLTNINQLPVELLTYIILLTNTLMGGYPHPYLLYTWVCHHWRSMLIQNSAFWTLIRHHRRHKSYEANSFEHELYRRSNSAKLDIILSFESLPFLPMLSDIFTKESDRIRKIQVVNDPDLVNLIRSSGSFPSLQGFAFTTQVEDVLLGVLSRLNLELGHSLDSVLPRPVFDSMLPILLASNHLEALDFTFWGNSAMYQPFNRIRKLSVHVGNSVLARTVLGLLDNSPNLEKLQLTIGSSFNDGISNQVVFPELRCLSIDDDSLMKQIWAPKLSSLDVTLNPYPNISSAIGENFDFSPIKHLYIRCPQSRRRVYRDAAHYCILGSKGRVDCETIFSSTTKILFEDASPHNCFHLRFDSDDSLAKGVKELTPSIFPRLTNLVELHLLIPLNHTLVDFQGIITELPWVEKLVIQRGTKLLEFIQFLNDNPVCPRLKHLSFKTFLLIRNFEKYAMDVGKALGRCLQLRQEKNLHELKFVALRNCPPLPKYWLQKLQQLGTAVVTETRVENIIVKGLELRPRIDTEPFSDVEI